MYKIADAHSDFLALNTLKEVDNRLYDHADLERMVAGGVALQTMAVWVSAENDDPEGAGLEQIRFLHTFAKNNSGVHIVTQSDHLASYQGVGIVLAIESGESIGCRVSNIKKIYNLGGRMLSLTWNGENSFASGCMAAGGLKPEGFKAVNELNRLNMALDLSHLNEQGFWDAMEHYEHNPCASHSCVYDLCPVPRNLKREQILHIISQYGFVGINFYPEFLCGKRYAQIPDILDHIEYILNMGGEDSVGFGSDFCGIQYTPEGMGSVADFQKLPEAMISRGYPDNLIRKICYGNFARYVLEFLQ